MKIQKLTIALCALGISSAALAGSYNVAASPYGTEAESPSAFSAGVEFIYVEPTGLNFADGERPEWAPGLRVNASYHFNEQYDITGSFMWFKKEQTRTIGYNMFSATQQSIDDEFWDVNMEFGRSVQNGALATRYHMGVKYANIQRNVGGKVINTGTGNVSTNVSSQHKTTAFGPRIGIQTEYEIMQSGFSVVGDFAASALLANSRFDTVGYTGTGPTGNLASGRTNNVIPAIEARLGGKYEFDTPDWQGQLALEGGYQWVSYIESIESPDSIKIGSTTVSLSDQRNFGFNGIYLGLKWNGSQLT